MSFDLAWFLQACVCTCLWPCLRSIPYPPTCSSTELARAVDGAKIDCSQPCERMLQNYGRACNLHQAPSWQRLKVRALTEACGHKRKNGIKPAIIISAATPCHDFAGNY